MQTVKKSQRVTVHQYMARMGVLNDCLTFLPMVLNSSIAVEGTKKRNVPFDEAVLAGIILNSVESRKALLQDLEAIKRIMDKRHEAGLKAKAKEASISAITKGTFKKRSASESPSEQVPKKGKSNKFCKHCKAKGGPHLTHNTKECCRYDRMGNPMTTDACKPGDAKQPSKKGGNKQMAYLMATVESLMKKGLKKAMKSKKRKHNLAYDSPSSSNSDSELEAGCHDTEHVVDKRCKLVEPFLSDIQSTQPHRIKVTDQILISTRADEKTLEIAKTGKVTAVVVKVKHLYGNTKSNARH
jgi:hypothetical protein